MKRRRAAEEDSGSIGIHIFINPFRPCGQYPPICYRPFDLIIFCVSSIERSSSVTSIQEQIRSPPKDNNSIKSNIDVLFKVLTRLS